MSANQYRPLPPTRDARPRTRAWWVVWACACSDVRVDRDALPERCPGHGRERLARPEVIDALNQYVDGHDCGDKPCPAVTA